MGNVDCNPDLNPCIFGMHSQALNNLIQKHKGVYQDGPYFFITYSDSVVHVSN